MFLQGLGLAVALLFVLWAAQKILREPAVADVGWSLSVALLAVFYFTAAEGLVLRKLLAFFMAFFWGIRLAAHVFFFRILGTQKDHRYRDAGEAWGEKRGIYLLGWFLLQGVLSAVFSLPCLTASSNAAPGLYSGEVIFFILWCFAMAGEIGADHQLAVFKSRSGNQGKVCRTGLWNLSRHPNYFFEILLWAMSAGFSSFSPWGWAAWVCPLTVGFFIFRVSGIPMTEARALKTKGEAYREYQRTTRLLIPWPKRK